jgi:hypothetical protein
MKSDKLELLFPNLRHTSYSVESQQTPRYNCIAWAAGENSRPWWPIDQKPYYWQEEPRIESLESFVNAFKGLGYEICENSGYEENFEKVAIYVDKDKVPTHMAKQHNAELWTSKCGNLEDIFHTLDGLEGYRYGTVALIMRRPIQP